MTSKIVYLNPNNIKNNSPITDFKNNYPYIDNPLNIPMFNHNSVNKNKNSPNNNNNDL